LTLDIEGVEELDLNSLSIEDLTGIEAFTALQFLNCGDNNIETLNLSSNTNLEEFYCYRNYDLFFINLANCTKLIALDAVGTRLDSLDLQDNIALEYLYIGSDGLFGSYLDLDLTNNPALFVLHISDIHLESIDLSNNHMLAIIDITQSFLSELDVSNCDNLKYLFCFSNELTSLDVSNNLELKVLDCGAWTTEHPANSFTELDLTNNINLEQLDCEYAFLDSPVDIDLSNSSNLVHVNLVYSNLSSLNIANGNNENLGLNTHYSTIDCINVDSEAIATIANADENDWTEEDEVIYSADCAGIGVAEEEYAAISVYPNPVKDMLYVNLGSSPLHKVVLYNVLGQEILVSTDSEIDMSVFPSGMYYVSVFVTDEKSRTFNIIIE
jgi:Leucine-rich repeat (LRR) protein